jgi:hypothetical protein
MRRLLHNIPCWKQLSYDSALLMPLPLSEQSISLFLHPKGGGGGDEINNSAQNINFQSGAIVQPTITRPPGFTYCLPPSFSKRTYTYAGTPPVIV